MGRKIYNYEYEVALEKIYRDKYLSEIVLDEILGYDKEKDEEPPATRRDNVASADCSATLADQLNSL